MAVEFLDKVAGGFGEQGSFLFEFDEAGQEDWSDRRPAVHCDQSDRSQ